jgi:hypothetical protein
VGLRRTIAYFEELLTRYGAVRKTRVTA